MSKHGEVVRSVAQPGSVLILVHHHVQPPVQTVFYAPVLANDFVKSLGRESRAQQVIRGFHCGFVRRFAYPNHLADRPQAGPLMLLLEPIDLRGNRRRAGLDPPVIGLDDWRCRGGLACRIVKKQDNIIMQCALISLQRQRIVVVLLIIWRKYLQAIWRMKYPYKAPWSTPDTRIRMLLHYKN